MSEQKLITEYNGIYTDIKTEIKKLENSTKVLNKLYVILDILYDVPIPEIIEKHDISQGTVYNWARQWETGGMDGLKRKPGSKGKSKLTESQFQELDKNIQELDLKTSKEVHDLILVNYHVDYSIRQIERIMKKLGYSYTKPYEINIEMPEDADIQFKKK
ncbi:MAG: hypothetical protein BZ136_07925 [Methanosphaera sp. rholeuAM74]|nr:MAG: hypothetical protein BZ136_07925 [Methanosphaera sp. rholeuAM74]